jgi:glutamine amidotransferase
MPDKVIIIDYGMGNLRSVQKKFKRIDADVEISSDLNKISEADKLILPGVGHFESGVKNLKERKIWDILNKKVMIEKVPILGICLGMQLMGGKSEEGNETGLQWFDAEIKRFNVIDKLKFKVPHTGWNKVVQKKESPLFLDISKDAQFYFVHAYHFNCFNPTDILTTSFYEYEFASSIQKDNIFGVQYHPEKSHDWGEKLLKNFLNISKQ